MSFNEELLTNLKQFIQEQNCIQTDKLNSHIDSKIAELQKIIKLQAEKNEELEKELKDVKERNKFLEKQIRKNDVIIFNLNHKEEDLISFTINKLNDALKLPTPLTECDINDIFAIGRSSNKPVVVSFARFLTKLSVLKNAKNLKGSKISISEILTVEERKENKILYQYLKQAKENNHKAHIHKNILYIDNKPYNAADLKFGVKEINLVGETETIIRNVEDNWQKKHAAELETQEDSTEIEEGKTDAVKKTIRTVTRRQKQIMK